MKLQLRYKEIQDRKFALAPINLMMVFQVNCPGCFIQGFPLLSELQSYYGSNLSCFALSTAFEDFTLNTLENTKSLITNGELVGETLKAHKEGLFEWDSKKITVPVLMDETLDREELLGQEFIDSILQNFGELMSSSEAVEQQGLRSSLQNYYSQIPKCGYTFAANLMRGTPSFFLFAENMEILAQWFGYVNSSVVREKLDILMKKTNGKIAL